jgi:hypothetical protein
LPGLESLNASDHPPQSPDLKDLDVLLASPSGVKVLALGLGGGLLAHALYGMTDAVTLVARPGILFWMLLGLISGLYIRQTRNPLSGTTHDA